MRRGTSRRRDKYEDDDREERTSRKRGSGSRKSGKRKFQYKSRDESSYRERARQRGGDRDGFVGSKIKIFSPRDGNNSIRILPPTWDEAEHFGYEFFVNYNIGADKNQYLSLDKMFNEDDPILEERKRALDEGDDKYADSLKPKKRCGIWLIDRKAEDEGPMFWAMPWTMDRDICAVSVDDDTNEVLNIDDPDNGFDVKFVSEKAKGGMKTYEAVKIARNESPIHDDEDQMEEWLEYVQDNPVPDILIKHDYDHIAKSFEGGRKDHDDEDDDDDDRPSRGGRHRRDEPDEDLDWDIIHEWSMSKMERLIRSEDLDLDSEDFEYDEDLADAICEELGIDEDDDDDDEPPRRSSSRSRGSSRKRSSGSKRSSGRRSSRDEDDDDDDDDRGGRSRMRRMRR